MAYLQGHPGEAAAQLRDALAGVHGMAASFGIADILEWLAAVAGAAGQSARAARLFGAAEQLRRDTGMARFAPDRPAYERDVAAVRAELDEAVFTASWAEGRAMSLD